MIVKYPFHPPIINVKLNTKTWNLPFTLLLGCTCGDPSPGGSGESTSGGILFDTSTSGTSDEGNDDIRLDVGHGLPDFYAGDETGCEDTVVEIDPVIPTLILLVDQSGSMTENFGGLSRWDAVYTTLMDPVDGAVPQLENRVRFGLALYTSNDGFNGGPCPMLTSVTPALNNAMVLDTIYAPEGPEGETPTGESLDEVALELASFSEPGPKGIVLATDGEPDTCAVPNPQQGQPESIAAAQNAWALGIQTFIVSVGNDVSQAHLQEMANAGSGKPLNEAVDPEPYYQALNPSELVDAFKQIIADFVTCEFVLEGEIVGDPCDGTVRLDGAEIECGTDWGATGSSTIELFGTACDSIKDGEEHTIEVVFPCDVVVIP